MEWSSGTPGQVPVGRRIVKLVGCFRLHQPVLQLVLGYNLFFIYSYIAWRNYKLISKSKGGTEKLRENKEAFCHHFELFIKPD